jgi:hypothetical protein
VTQKVFVARAAGADAFRQLSEAMIELVEAGLITISDTHGILGADRAGSPDCLTIGDVAGRDDHGVPRPAAQSVQVAVAVTVEVFGLGKTANGRCGLS